MLAASLALLLAAAALLVGGVLLEEVLAVYAAIAASVLAALLLAAGVARNRPRRHEHVQAPTWSGAGDGPAASRHEQHDPEPPGE